MLFVYLSLFFNAVSCDKTQSKIDFFSSSEREKTREREDEREDESLKEAEREINYWTEREREIRFARRSVWRFNDSSSSSNSGGLV